MFKHNDKHTRTETTFNNVLKTSWESKICKKKCQSNSKSNSNNFLLIIKSRTYILDPNK